MIIDCEQCVMEHTGVCSDCVVTALLDIAPGRPVALADDEETALEHLAAAGLVAPIRLIPRRDRPARAEGA